ncbi:MAG: GspH/FimT family pseudopilin [Methylotenera sp.]|nr:GspH/FimT family pseudopilin [Methylotenera sp.]
MRSTCPGPAGSPRHRGLTLVEILVGLVVLGVLVAVAIPALGDVLERRRVMAAADEIAGVLTYAKAETVAINTPLWVRFDPDPNNSLSCTAVVTLSSSDTCRCYYAANNICPNTGAKLLRLFQLPRQHVRFSAQASAWGGPANYISFSRDQMSISARNFQVNVVGLRHGYTLRVEVNTGGRVKICSPGGSINGYAVCA